MPGPHSFRQILSTNGRMPEVLLVPDPWLSADDIATHLGVTKDSVYAWIAEKGMPAHKVGRLWKFQKLEVDTWVKAGGASEDSQQVQHDG